MLYFSSMDLGPAGTSDVVAVETRERNADAIFNSAEGTEWLAGNGLARSQFVEEATACVALLSLVYRE